MSTEERAKLGAFYFFLVHEWVLPDKIAKYILLIGQ